MSKIAYLIICLLFSRTVSAQSWISAAGAIDRSGAAVNVVGKITKLEFVKYKTKDKVFLQLDENRVKGQLVIVIDNCSWGQSKKLEDSFLDQYVQISGKIKKHKGHVYMHIADSSRITIARDGDSLFATAPE